MIEIFASSSEWAHVLFRIQTMLADSSVSLNKLIKYNIEFDQKYRQFMKIDSVIDVSNLDQDQIQCAKYQNCNKYIFEAGHVKVQTRREGQVYKFLLFKLAVDQCMPIHKSGAYQLAKISQFPNGIDTIYVSSSKEELNIYPHQYRVKNKLQCCLQYEVHFQIKGTQSLKKWDPESSLCDFCQIAQALYYCPQDKQLYCGKCYEELHRSTRKKTHGQIKVSPFTLTSFCSYHPKQRFSSYCFDCMQLRCDICVQSQIHKNDKKHDEVMSLCDLEKVLKQKQIAFMREAKERVKGLILEAESGLSKLTKSYEKQKLDLEQKFAIKLSKIKDESNKKIMRVVSLHSEFKRKYDELLWVQNFVHYCQEFLEAEQNIKMKDSFFTYLNNITPKEYFVQSLKNLNDVV